MLRQKRQGCPSACRKWTTRACSTRAGACCPARAFGEAAKQRFVLAITADVREQHRDGPRAKSHKLVQRTCFEARVETRRQHIAQARKLDLESSHEVMRQLWPQSTRRNTTTPRRESRRSRTLRFCESRPWWEQKKGGNRPGCCQSRRKPELSLPSRSVPCSSRARKQPSHTMSTVTIAVAGRR